MNRPARGRVPDGRGGRAGGGQRSGVTRQSLEFSRDPIEVGAQAGRDGQRHFQITVFNQQAQNVHGPVSSRQFVEDFFQFLVSHRGSVSISFIVESRTSGGPKTKNG